MNRNVTVAVRAFDNQAREALAGLSLPDFLAVYRTLVEINNEPTLTARNTQRFRARLIGTSEGYYSELLAGKTGTVSGVLDLMRKWKAWNDAPDRARIPDLDYTAIENVLLGRSDG